MRVNKIPMVQVNLKQSNPVPKNKKHGGKNFKELLIKCLTEDKVSANLLSDRNNTKEKDQ